MPPTLDELLVRTGLPDKPDPYYEGMTVGDVDTCGSDDTKARRIVVGNTGGAYYVDFPEVENLNPQFHAANVDSYFTGILTALGGFVYSREAQGSGGRTIPLGQGMLHLCKEGNAVYISDNAVINNMAANPTALVRLPVALPFRVIRELVHSGILQPSHYQLDPAGRPDFRYLNLLPDAALIDRLVAFVEKADSPVPEDWRPVVVQDLVGIKPPGEEIARKGQKLQEKGLEMQEEMRSEMMWQILGATAMGVLGGIYTALLVGGKAGTIHSAVSAPFRGLYHLLKAPFDGGEGLARFWRDATSGLRYSGIPTLLKVGTNMTEQARLGEFRPVADPTTPKVAEQIENTINSRFNTMSVLVEGPPGWGKEEVMKTLALRNPNTVFIKVTPNGLMGGTMYRGQLEERLTDIPREIMKARKSGRPVVLFVDEFHEALSAGKSMEQTTSLLEHWKGDIARGELQIVAFSTPEEMLKSRYIAGYYNDPAARARLSPEHQEIVARFEKEGVRQNIELRPLLNRFQPLALPARPASDIEIILEDAIQARKDSGLTVEMDHATVKRIAQLSESPLASEGHIPRTAFAIFNGVVDANATQGSGNVRVTTAMIDAYVGTNYPDIAQRFQGAGGTPPPKEIFTEKTFADQIRTHYAELWDPKFEKYVGAAARVAQQRWNAAAAADPANPPLTIASGHAFPSEEYMEGALQDLAARLDPLKHAHVKEFRGIVENGGVGPGHIEDYPNGLLEAGRRAFLEVSGTPLAAPPPAAGVASHEVERPLIDRLRESMTQKREVEFFVRGSKEKYVGWIDAIHGDPVNPTVILRSGENGKKSFSFDQIVTIRGRDKTDELSSRYIRVPNPQFRDKTINVSGTDGSGMVVLVDYEDPRLTGFIDQYIRPIRDRLDGGQITQHESAIEVWRAVRDYVPYDSPRVRNGGIPNQLYRLGDFIETGVCNERGMLVQVALQYIGVESRMEKGSFGNERHAWVRSSFAKGSGERVDVILDPQIDRPLVVGVDDMAKYYQDDSTPFAKEKVGTVVVGGNEIALAQGAGTAEPSAAEREKELLRALIDENPQFFPDSEKLLKLVEETRGVEARENREPAKLEDLIVRHVEELKIEKAQAETLKAAVRSIDARMESARKEERERKEKEKKGH